jgi:hypothetical protein
MHESYCFRCGVYTHIDSLTKLCGACYECWPAVQRTSRATR